MAEQTRNNPEIIEFIRKRDYKFVKELGQGACGKTVLLRDEDIDTLYVCKKYLPFSEAHRHELFAGFVREVKLLHELQHRNVVRIFNHYLFPEQCAGYILMEHVTGSNIDEYVAKFPERSSDAFLQAIAGFSYLEEMGILHRDIRPANLMVQENGVLKIIDLGFGKRVRVSKDFAKSISLNWAYAPPAEFADGRYDFRTEVYFVGKLFEDLIHGNALSQFKYPTILGAMCQRDAEQRISSFRDVEQRIGTDQFAEITFADWEQSAYRDFADAMSRHISKIDHGAKYIDDIGQVSRRLNNVYQKFMLEAEVPDCSTVIQCFITGEYYRKKKGMPVDCVKAFGQLLSTCGAEKGRIILANLHTRIDAILKYSKEAEFRAEDIPF